MHGTVDDADVADALAAAALTDLRRRGVTRIVANGCLPVPGVHGVPDRWPHVEAALLRAGFVVGERAEAVLAASTDDLPRGGPPPLRRELAEAVVTPSIDIDEGGLAFLTHVGFREPTRTRRDWSREPGGVGGDERDATVVEP
jgi:hypothetical protein